MASEMRDLNAALWAAAGTLSKLKYLRELRNAVAAFVRDEVKPLMKF